MLSRPIQLTNRRTALFEYFLSLMVMCIAICLGCSDQDNNSSTDASMKRRDAAMSSHNDSDVNTADQEDASVIPLPDQNVETVDAQPTENDSSVDAQPLDLDAQSPDLGPLPSECRVRILVNLPNPIDEQENVYMAGDFCQFECLDGEMNNECCDWNPADPQFRDQVDSRMNTQVVFELQLPSEQDFEFKFTRGSWSSVEKAENCDELPNRRLRVACPSGEIYEFETTIEYWATECP